MARTLEDHVLPFHCPKCGAKIEKAVVWLRTNGEFECPCGATMHLGTEKVLEAVEALEEALNRISRPAPGEEKIVA